MPSAVVCCKVMEREVRSVASRLAPQAMVEVMDWGLHVKPERLLAHLNAAIRRLEDKVDAVVLGFGRCQCLDKLPTDFKVPVIYPPGEDCIGVLLGQERYLEELYRQAGTWFITPGWADLGMEGIFSEVQAADLAAKGIDPMTVARRMLKDYTRALVIDTGVGDASVLRQKSEAIAATFNWRLDATTGSLERLEAAVVKALALAGRY